MIRQSLEYKEYNSDFLVIGGGIIGLLITYLLATFGYHIIIVDDKGFSTN